MEKDPNINEEVQSLLDSLTEHGKNQRRQQDLSALIDHLDAEENKGTRRNTRSLLWWINTGLRCDFYYRRMSHQLKQQNGTLVITDNQIPTTQHIISNSYLSVPIIFSRVSKNHPENSLDFDISVGRLFEAKFFTREPSNSLGDWTSRSAKDLFNPWKIELGVSLNTNSLGIIHGVRFYVNLLPEYKKSIAPESFQRVGFEFRL